MSANPDLESLAPSFKEYASQQRFDILSLDRGELRRQDKLFELANFERNYVANLQTLKDKVIQPLRERGLFAQGDMEALFSNVEDILELHKEFLHHLVTQQRENTVISRLHGEGNFLGRLALYRDYADEHDRQRKRLMLLQKQAEFQDFLEAAWQKMERKDVDLYSYLSLPFYQVVQYPPILQKILKNTPDSHPDARHLRETIPAAEQLAKKCRETFLAVQNATRMQELQEQVEGFDVLKHGREFIREGVVEVIDSHPHKRYALLFNDVLLLVRPKGKTFKAIRPIPVRKALYQFGDDILQVLFDYNQLARLRFPASVRAMWYKTLKGMQQSNKRWPTDIRLANKKEAAASGGGGSASASELEEMKRKQRKLLQLVDKYEQLSSLHLTALAKNDAIVSDLNKRVARLEKQVQVMGGETAVDFVALDAEKEKLLLENLALREGLSQVEQKVRSRRLSQKYSSEDEDDSAARAGSRTASVSSVVDESSEAEAAAVRASRPWSTAGTPARAETTFDDFTMKSVISSSGKVGGNSTTLDDILTPDVVEAAIVASRSHSSNTEEEESSTFVEP